VTDNPHHARTGLDGHFEIRDVPPGQWTLRLWHERLGEQRISIEVLPGRTVDVGTLVYPKQP
jgi:hypothetical protein